MVTEDKIMDKWSQASTFDRIILFVFLKYYKRGIGNAKSRTSWGT